MTANWKAECLALLEAMQSGQEWNPATHALMYGVVLDELGADAARAAVVHAVRTLKWRPAPCELREIAEKLGGGIPDASEVAAEISARVRQFGQHGRQHPERPGLYLAGAPEMSALAAAVVDRLGGWQDVCMRQTECNVPVEKAIAAAHTSVMEQARFGNERYAALASPEGARSLVSVNDRQQGSLTRADAAEAMRLIGARKEGAA